jgi:hypothetical protein
MTGKLEGNACNLAPYTPVQPEPTFWDCYSKPSTRTSQDLLRQISSMTRTYHGTCFLGWGSSQPCCSGRGTSCHGAWWRPEELATFALARDRWSSLPWSLGAGGRSMAARGARLEVGRRSTSAGGGWAEYHGGRRSSWAGDGWGMDEMMAEGEMRTGPSWYR